MSATLPESPPILTEANGQESISHSDYIILPIPARIFGVMMANILIRAEDALVLTFNGIRSALRGDNDSPPDAEV